MDLLGIPQDAGAVRIIAPAQIFTLKLSTSNRDWEPIKVERDAQFLECSARETLEQD